MPADLAEFPRKLAFLFEPHRYKVLWGGRGGMKSWGAARALLTISASETSRNLCCREFQSSINTSVHQLLRDQIDNLNLFGFYDVGRDAITGRNDSLFSFEGLKHNASRIKSKEGYDRTWVEEGESVSKDSWDTLIPTIRKPKSEIWITFNPQLESDETYRRFVLNPPPNARVVKVGWRDNPWFPDVLRDEKNLMMQRDYQGFLNVWEGHCKQILEGTVYAKELLAMVAEHRETSVPYNPIVPVHTFWDLGIADKMAIWFMQQVGFEYHFIDYLENTGEKLGWYLEQLQRRKYIYGRHYLPHDGTARELGTGKSIEELMRTQGFPTVIVPRANPADGINAVREQFQLCWFDKVKCADGLQALRHYRYEKSEKLSSDGHLQYGAAPLHDWASHGADALRCFGMGYRQDKKPMPKKNIYQPTDRSQTAWMS